MLYKSVYFSKTEKRPSAVGLDARCGYGCLQGSDGTSGPSRPHLLAHAPLLSPAPRGGRETPVSADASSQIPRNHRERPRGQEAVSEAMLSCVHTCPSHGPRACGAPAGQAGCTLLPSLNPRPGGTPRARGTRPAVPLGKWEAPSLRPDLGTASHGLARTSCGAAGARRGSLEGWAQRPRKASPGRSDSHGTKVPWRTNRDEPARRRQPGLTCVPRGRMLSPPVEAVVQGGAGHAGGAQRLGLVPAEKSPRELASSVPSA